MYVYVCIYINILCTYIYICIHTYILQDRPQVMLILPSHRVQVRLTPRGASALAKASRPWHGRDIPALASGKGMTPVVNIGEIKSGMLT